MNKLNPPPNNLKPSSPSDNPESPTDWKVSLKDTDILGVLHQEWNLSRDLQGILSTLVGNGVIPRLRAGEFYKDLEVLTEALQNQGLIRKAKNFSMVRFVLTHKYLEKKRDT
jgi:hypothetical protein